MPNFVDASIFTCLRIDTHSESRTHAPASRAEKHTERNFKREKRGGGEEADGALRTSGGGATGDDDDNITRDIERGLPIGTSQDWSCGGGGGGEILASN